MRRLLTAIASIGLLVAAPAFAQTPSKIERNPDLDKKLEKQLEPTLKKFEAAWNKDDAKTMASLFTEDAVLINPMGRQARGRAEVEKLFRDEHAGMLKGTKYEQKVLDVRALGPNYALVDSQITIDGMKDPSGQKLPKFDVHGAWVFEKKGDQWQVLEGRPTHYSQPQAQQGVGGSGLEEGQPQQQQKEPGPDHPEKKGTEPSPPSERR